MRKSFEISSHPRFYETYLPSLPGRLRSVCKEAGSFTPTSSLSSHCLSALSLSYSFRRRPIFTPSRFHPLQRPFFMAQHVGLVLDFHFDVPLSHALPHFQLICRHVCVGLKTTWYSLMLTVRYTPTLYGAILHVH